MNVEAIAKLKARVIVRDGCWVWQGYLAPNGYGQVKVLGRRMLAHRLAYELLVDRACVNPDHLEAVTTRENLLRGEGTAGRNARKTHCKWGHEFTEDNTYRVRTRAGTVGRACMACRRAVWEKKARA